MRTLRGALAALLVGALAAGALLLSGALLVRCTASSSTAIEVEFDEGLEKAIAELVGSRPFKELAPGDWTSVHVFSGPFSANWLSKKMGQPVELYGDVIYEGDYLQEGDLVVFKFNGKIVRIIRLEYLAALGDGEYRADVVLQRTPARTIKMVNPDGTPAN